MPTSGTATQRNSYFLAEQLIAVRVVTGSNSTLYFTFADHLGNVSAVTYSGGTLVAGSLARYEPYGGFRTEPTSNPAITDRGFTGHKSNNTGTYDIGLVYMNARYYLPEIGRFISADTIVPSPQNPQSFNRYAYSLNNPIGYTDPSGHCAVDTGGNILLDGHGKLAKTDCTVDDFQALSWEQRSAWLDLFIAENSFGNWFVDIARVINIFSADPDYSAMVGWAAYADAGVLQAINDGWRMAQGQNALGSGGVNGGAAWALFFQAFGETGELSTDESHLIILRLAGEQGGVDYATGLAETQRRYDALTTRVEFKSWMFLTGANAYRSSGRRCHAGCSNPLTGAGAIIEDLVVAHTDPRTSGETRFIQYLAQRPEAISRFFFPYSP